MPCWVFLVGGAGNGKSKLARDVLGELDAAPSNPPSSFAQRSYRFQTRRGRDLVLVNDATIPPADRVAFPLAADLDAVLAERSDLLACVNRGVLIGEALGARRDDHVHEAVSWQVINWLLWQEIPPVACDGVPVLEDQPVSKDHGGGYRFGLVRAGDQLVASVHAVFLDQASLLEAWPTTTERACDPGAPLEAEPWRVAPILGRDLLGAEDIPFAECLSSLGSLFPGDGASNQLDPVAANAASLVRAAPAWCALARGAEIMRGAPFTYRELWALAVHSLVGPGVLLGRLSQHVGQLLGQASSGEQEQRLTALLSLAEVRSHVLLFEAGRGARPRLPLGATRFPWPRARSEALEAAWLADPVRDFGERDGASYADLVRRLAGIDDKLLPLEELSRDDPLVAAYIQPLDLAVEQAISDILSGDGPDVPLEERNALLGWYGTYATRLVGLARGRPAFSSACNRWQLAYREAKTSGRLGSDLEESILEIFLPGSRKGGGSARCPVFRPSVHAATSEEAMIAVELDTSKFRLGAAASGSTVALNLLGGPRGEKAAEALLDFHLVREAVARREGGGFTDSLPLVEPRVERARASLLAFAVNSDPEPRYVFAGVGHDGLSTT